MEMDRRFFLASIAAVLTTACVGAKATVVDAIETPVPGASLLGKDWFEQWYGISRFDRAAVPIFKEMEFIEDEDVLRFLCLSGTEEPAELTDFIGGEFVKYGESFKQPKWPVERWANASRQTSLAV